MADLNQTVIASLDARFVKLSGGVRELAAPLSDEDFWAKPFPFGNSFGHLVLHLTGNLSYYIGAQIAGTGYVRDRPREFADPSRRAKDDVLRDLDGAVDMVLATLAAQAEGDWGKAYSAVGAEGVADRLTMFVRCAAHADHHAGQI